MIRITANGTDLQLSPNTSLEWVRTNPLFSEDVNLEIDRSFNFKIPKTASNVVLLSENQVIDNCQLYVEGRLFMRAKLHILATDRDYYDVSLTAQVYKIDLDTNISELDWETTTVILGGPIKDSANNAGLDGSDFVFPVVKNINGSANKALNNIFELVTELELINQDGVNVSGDRVDRLTPMFGLRHVLTKVISQSTNMSINGDFLNGISDLIIYNNTLINNDEINFVFEIDNSGGGVKFIIPSLDTFDIQIGDVIGVDIYLSRPGGNISGKRLKYVVSASDFDSAGNVDVAQFFINFRNEIIKSENPAFPDYQTPNLVYNTVADNPYFSFSSASTITEYAYLQKDIANLFFDINAKSHIPNITTSDFLKGIKDFFCLCLVPNYEKEELNFLSRKQLLQTAKYKDYTAKLLYGESIELDQPIAYRFVYANESNDALAKDPFYRTHANNHPEHVAYGYQDKTIACATTNVIDITTPTLTYQIPYVSQDIKYASDDYSSTSLRILRYKGFKENSAKYGRVFLADSQGLNPNQAYNAYWRDWYSLFKNGVMIYKFPMILSASDVLGIDPERKWKILHHMYLWKEIRTSITMKHGIGESLVYAAKVSYSNEETQAGIVISNDQEVMQG